MNNSLVIFRQKNYYFGLISEDFDNRISLDQCWITATNIAPSIWHFSKEDDSRKGIFVHLGALFGLPMVEFSHTGYLFLKEIKDLHLEIPQKQFGILMDNYFNKISLTEVRQNRMNIESFSDLPPEIPKSAFRYIYVYRKKKILIIDPLMLLRSYKELFPANV